MKSSQKQQPLLGRYSSWTSDQPFPQSAGTRLQRTRHSILSWLLQLMAALSAPTAMGIAVQGAHLSLQACIPPPHHSQLPSVFLQCCPSLLAYWQGTRNKSILAYNHPAELLPSPAPAPCRQTFLGAVHGVFLVAEFILEMHRSGDSYSHVGPDWIMKISSAGKKHHFAIQCDHVHKYNMDVPRLS